MRPRDGPVRSPHRIPSRSRGCPVGIEKEIEQGQREGRLHHALYRFREFTGRHPVLRLLHKVVVSAVGGVIVLAGVIMLVTPGPGWLAIFLGLGVLATEYPIIHRFNQWAKSKVVAVWHRFTAWRAARALRRERTQEQRARARIAKKQHKEFLDAQFRRSHNCAPHRPTSSPGLVLPHAQGRTRRIRRVPKV